jgi:hypothetical protein
MNFLEICQSIVREGGISGSLANVTGQSGEHLRVVNWANGAYRYILNMHKEWKFLRKDLAFPVIVGTAEYSASAMSLADFGEWKLDSFRAYTTDIGFADEQFVRCVRNYDDFRNRYMMGAMRSVTGRPQLVAEKPDQNLRIFPIPDAAYTVTGEYYRVPADMAVNADLPIFPARFHKAVVWRALMFYAEYEGDASLFASAQTEFGREISQMELRFLPDMEASGPMA